MLGVNFRASRHGLVAGLIFFILMLPLVFRPSIDVYDDFDEGVFHYATVMQFVEQMPEYDFVTYASATTPLYHLFMAALVRLFGFELVGLRVVNLLLSVALVYVAFRLFSGDPYKPQIYILTACFAFSPYFVGPAVRLSTDNVALLFVVLTIAALHPPNFSLQRYGLAALFMSLAVMIRQNYIWLIPAGILRSMMGKSTLHLRLHRRLAASALFALPLLLLLAFIVLWGGLVPPDFQLDHASDSLLNWRSVGYGVAVLGSYSIFFAPWLWHFRNVMDIRWYTIVLVLVIAVGYLVLFPVSPRTGVINEHNEGGLLWSISRFLPVVMGSSLIFWVTVPLGILTLYILFRKSQGSIQRWFWMISIMWLAVYLLNGRVYQKYFEPYWLFFLAYSIRNYVAVMPRWVWFFPGTLVLIFLGIDFVRFYI